MPIAVFAVANAGFGLGALLRPTFHLVGLVYLFHTAVMPVLLLLAAAGFVLALGPRSAGPPPAAPGWMILAALGLAGFGFYASRIEPRRLVVRQVAWRTDRLTAPVRLLHMSDIQAARIGPYERRVFDRARTLAPDIVIHTGDMLQPVRPATFASETPMLTSLFRTLRPPLGLWGVCGDMDFGFEHRGLPQVGPLRLIGGEQVAIETAGGRIRLLGLSLAESRGARDPADRVREWLRAAAPRDVNIVVGHSPDYVLRILDLPVDLCLAGHTHGGQVRLPFIGPLVTLSRAPRAWSRGFRLVGRTRLNVSAGIGCERTALLPPIRFLCPPEVTLIDILPETTPSSTLEAMAGTSAAEPMRPGRLAQATLSFLAANRPSARALALGGPPALFWSWACLSVAAWLKKRRGWLTAFTRKVFHFLIFGSAAAAHALWGTRGVCLFGAMVTVVIFAAVLRGAGDPRYEALARESDAPRRTHFVIVPYFATLAGGLASNILFGPAAVAGYLVAGLGDAIGEPVGARFGRHRYAAPAWGAVRSARSLEGSAAVFAVCLAAVAAAWPTAAGSAPLGPGTAAAIAAACTAVEAVSPHGWDNVTMQVVPSFLVSSLL